MISEAVSSDLNRLATIGCDAVRRKQLNRSDTVAKSAMRTGIATGLGRIARDFWSVRRHSYPLGRPAFIAVDNSLPSNNDWHLPRFKAAL